MSVSNRLAATLGTALVLGSGAIACDGEEPTAEARAGAVRSAIVEGTLSTTAQDSVVLIGVFAGAEMQSACTGSLIAKNLILTARHCVAQIDEERGLVVADRTPSTLAIYSGVDAFPRADRGEAPIARGSRLFVPKGTTLFPTDVALILVDKPIAGTLMSLRLTSGAVVGEGITAVGYGRVEGGPISASRLQRTDLSITRTGPALLPLGNTIAQGEFTLGESTCSGDSGGPSISAKTGAVIGVLSRVGNGVSVAAVQENPAAFCVGANTVAIYTGLASVKPLIDEAFAAASASPVLEGQSTAPALADEEDEGTAKPTTDEPAPKSAKTRRIAQPTESAGCSAGPPSAGFSVSGSPGAFGLALGLALAVAARRRRV
jgi:hypothetical protein